jgi:NAD(P)-dependent dehydrogenase (short-subunit alcohol dehydrogenase family)
LQNAVVADERVRSVLVTGASTGIGAATVDALVTSGWRVWASVRSEVDDQRLTSKYGERVRVLRFDVTDADAVTAACGRVVAEGPLDGVVTTRDRGAWSAWSSADRSLVRSSWTNLLGQLRVIRRAACDPVRICHRCGRLDRGSHRRADGGRVPRVEVRRRA